MGLLQQVTKLSGRAMIQAGSRLRVCQKHIQQIMPSLSAFFIRSALGPRRNTSSKGQSKKLVFPVVYENHVPLTKIPGELSFNTNNIPPLTILGKQSCDDYQNKNHTQNFSSSQRLSTDNLQNSEPSPRGSPKRPLKLMEFQHAVWPHFIKVIRAKFLTFLIRSYFDEEFSNSNFLEGAQQAVYVVSNAISNGQFELLDNLVTKEALSEIKQNYKLLSPEQKKFVAVKQDDIFVKFIHEIGMIFDDQGQRYVEVTTVFHGFHGYHKEIDIHESQNVMEQVNMLKERDIHKQHYICNYRFLREYTKGISADWIINKLNHFSTQEMVNESNIFKR